MSTLQGAAVRQAWQSRTHYYPRRDESQLFTNLLLWHPDQMRRLGEAHAALEPISYDYGFFGTKKSPDWLRHVVTLWLGHGRKDQPITTLLGLVENSGQETALTLDILFCRDTASYGSSNSVDRFAGVGDWLASAREAVHAALPGLAADVRAELAAAIGRLRIHSIYLDVLLDTAIGSSKKARTSARQALTGADGAALTEALRAHFGGATPGRKAELIDVAATALGAAAAPLLTEWRESESAAKVVSALDRVSASLAPTQPAAGAQPVSPWRVDGPQGYVAVDGSWVELAAPEPLLESTPVPAEVLRLLEPALAEFNRLLSIGQAEAKSVKHWHWSRQFSAKDSRDLNNLAKLAEGTWPIETNSKRTAVDWMRWHQLKHPAVGAFLQDPRLSLYHLMRIAVAMTNGHIQGLFGDWSGPIGAAVQHRLTQGADVRTVLALWRRAGGDDHIHEHLTRRWYWPMPELDTPIWPVLCERFGQLDEALGMVPQSGADAMQRQPAIDLLGMFPKLPERYRGPLMLLAGDSSARLRQGARALLQDTPGIGSAIAVQLQDGRQETRALAADWLAARGEREHAPAIRAALTKERSDRARAAMITALERLGEDVSEYFDHAALAKEAKAGLAKPRPKGFDWLPFASLPALAWRDGTSVDPVLPEWWAVLAVKLKQPGGNALINLWLDRLMPQDAHRLGWLILTGWIDEDTRTPTDEEANAYAAANVDAMLQQNLRLVKQYPGSADYWPTDRAVLFAQLKRAKAGTYLGSAADSKGVLALATRVNGADAAQRIRIFLKDHGSRVSQAKALIELLAAIGTGSALQLLLSAANRSKQRSVQAHAAALVEAVAEQNGWSAAQLADRTIPTGGFGTDGTQELDCGENRSYRLQLDAQDAVIILNAEGREVKALPGPRIDDERPTVDAAKKQLANARKEVKQVLAAQTERLQEAMCLQRRWSRAEWESFVAGHPIVGRIAARLVWQGVDGEGQVLGSFRPLGDGSYTDSTDGEVDLAAFTQIELAHSSLLDATTIAAWRSHLADYAVEPPFDQLSRDLPQLDEGQDKARAISDREGWMIESFKLRGAATRLGYQRGQAQDGGWFLTYEKTYREAGLLVEIEFTGSPLPEENRPTALQSISFRKVRAGASGGGGQVALGDVPPVLLAECWRDLHDIAGKGTGFDPEWQKKAYM
ncbi:DUF4132 domain-containing protein [Sphingomonas sp. HF-S3]|uniref:DUF4132 domain-containing protein n=1 Tax=Sphingomonas rustica TaxID=3103142 RepID=A0ABV0B8S0_9SPHN